MWMRNKLCHCFLNRAHLLRGLFACLLQCHAKYPFSTDKGIIIKIKCVVIINIHRKITDDKFRDKEFNLNNLVDICHNTTIFSTSELINLLGRRTCNCFYETECKLIRKINMKDGDIWFVFVV